MLSITKLEAVNLAPAENAFMMHNGLEVNTSATAPPEATRFRVVHSSFELPTRADSNFPIFFTRYIGI